MRPELWARLQPLTFRWADPSNDSSPRVMFSNERPPFDSLQPQPQTTSVVSISDLNVLIISRVDLVGPGSPGSDEMTHSTLCLISKHWRTLTFWLASGFLHAEGLWPDVCLVKSLLFSFSLYAHQVASVATPWPLHDDCLDACIVSGISAKKKGFIHFSGWLTGGIETRHLHVWQGTENQGGLQNTDSQVTRYRQLLTFHFYIHYDSNRSQINWSHSDRIKHHLEKNATLNTECS